MDHSSDWSHETVLAPAAISASRARPSSSSIVVHTPRYLIEDVRRVVSELATNAPVHA